MSDALKTDNIGNTVSLTEVVTAISLNQPILNMDELPSQNNIEKEAITDGTTKVITGVNSLNDANHNELSFLSDAAYKTLLKKTQAGVVIVSLEYIDNVPVTAIPIVVKSPYLAYASASVLFDTNLFDTKANQYLTAHIHPTAQIADSVTLGNRVTIGAYCVIGEHVTIGDDTHIQSNTVIGRDVNIGQQCLITNHVSIAHGCQIGHAVRIHSHASIGSEGFGFAPTDNPASTGWQRIAQLGRVVIGNNVRIGSQTCIDRGAISDTVIEDNVIIDNLVQIAHNVRIGAGTAIAAKTGIAGSTAIGKRCIIGGAVGIVGHIEIADDVTLTSMTMVTKSIKNSGSYSSGTTAMPTIDWRRAAVRFKNMGKKQS